MRVLVDLVGITSTIILPLRVGTSTFDRVDRFDEPPATDQLPSMSPLFPSTPPQKSRRGDRSLIW
jgi:hypothetical protein